MPNLLTDFNNLFINLQVSISCPTRLRTCGRSKHLSKHCHILNSHKTKRKSFWTKSHRTPRINIYYEKHRARIWQAVNNFQLSRKNTLTLLSNLVIDSFHSLISIYLLSKLDLLICFSFGNQYGWDKSCVTWQAVSHEAD